MQINNCITFPRNSLNLCKFAPLSHFHALIVNSYLHTTLPLYWDTERQRKLLAFSGPSGHQIGIIRSCHFEVMQET